MAERLKIDPDSVVGKLIRVWVWADQNSVDGNEISVTDSFLDRLAHRKGFAKAMRSAGWLTGKDGGLIFPAFERHNGTTAKARAETNRRVANHRKRNGNVTEKALQKPLPEKRREEKNTPTECNPLPPKGELVISGKVDLVAIVDAYPRRQDQAAALDALKVSIRKGADPDVVLAGTRAIAAVIQQLPSGALNAYVVSAATFFKNERWRDDPKTWVRSGASKNGAQVGQLNLGGRKPAAWAEA